MEMIYVGEDTLNVFTNGSAYNISKHSSGYAETKNDSGLSHSLDIYFVLKHFVHPTHYKPEPEQRLECIYQVGDTVYHWQHGEGNIYQISHERNKLFPIFVKFDSVVYQFTTDGKQNVNDKEPSLSFTPYGLKNGGFSQERPKPEPKIGDVGYFWNDENFLCAYAEIEHISRGSTFEFKPKNADYFKNFSHEPPAHIK